MKYIRIFIFSILIFYLSNYLLYAFNFTDFLIWNELIFNDDLLINFISLSIYIFLIFSLLTILSFMYIKLLKNKFILFINNLIIVVIVFIFIKFILKNDKLLTLENDLCLIFTLFFTTYVFYYSIYQISLLKYIGYKN